MPRVAKKLEVEIKPPSPGTMKKYGLTLESWMEYGSSQNWTCPICLKPFGDRMLVIDHEHVKGFRARKRQKGKKKKDGKRIDVRVRVMSPEERSRYVRGILHAWCNSYVRVWLTLERASAIVEYLKAHEVRKRMR